MPGAKFDHGRDLIRQARQYDRGRQIFFQCISVTLVHEQLIRVRHHVLSPHNGAQFRYDLGSNWLCRGNGHNAINLSEHRGPCRGGDQFPIFVSIRGMGLTRCLISITASPLINSTSGSATFILFVPAHRRTKLCLTRNFGLGVSSCWEY
jgi:hypothetical protein